MKNSDSNKQSSSNLLKFEVGQMFPIEKYVGRGELVVGAFNEASFDVIISLFDVTSQEINVFRKGEMEIGLFEYKNVPFLYLDFRDFSFDFALNINKLSEKDIDTWLNMESNLVNLYMIDSESGILKGQRMISISFLEDIRDVLAKETELTVSEVETIISEVNSKYTTKQIRQQAIKKMIFKKR